MASFSGLRIGNILPLVLGLVLALIQAEGGRAIASRLSGEEEMELKRKLNILNKPPVKTMRTGWGDIYDCIEFYKQPAFDNPLLKNHTIPKKYETTSPRPPKTWMRQIEGCPKGTVPIRRTTKEDLIRAKYVSSSSNIPDPGDEILAGITLHVPGQRFFGASGIANVWNPKVNSYQTSGGEFSLISGPTDPSKQTNGILVQREINELRFGWEVSPQYYGDNVTRTYAYWTGDGYMTGCRNTLCPGFVQLDPIYPLVMAFPNTSVNGGTQVELKSILDMDRETGNWLLIVEIAGSNITIGYWPKALFPLFEFGAEHIYFGGRVRSDLDGIFPEMSSGKFPDAFPYTDNITGYYVALKFKDRDHNIWDANNQDYQYTVDCKGSYNSTWEYEENTLHYGGPGGRTCA